MERVGSRAPHCRAPRRCTAERMYMHTCARALLPGRWPPASSPGKPHGTGAATDTIAQPCLCFPHLPWWHRTPQPGCLLSRSLGIALLYHFPALCTCSQPPHLVQAHDRQGWIQFSESAAWLTINDMPFPDSQDTSTRSWLYIFCYRATMLEGAMKFCSGYMEHKMALFNIYVWCSTFLFIQE